MRKKRLFHKKAGAVLLPLCLAAGLLSGCGGGSTDTKTEDNASAGEKVFYYGDTTFNAENDESDVNPHNGYSGWDHVYLQYDFGKVRDVKEIDLYHNTYPNAVSTFKDVKVELSSTEDFAESTIVSDTADYEETTSNKGKATAMAFSLMK